MTEKKNSKIGRPKLPKAKAKGVIIQFRVSETEAKSIKSAGGGTWARDIVLAAASKS